MLVTGIDHIQIAAPPGCEAAARHFFGELLQLAEIEKPDALRTRGGCWFQVGTWQLHIGVDPSFRPATKAHPAFTAGDIDGLFDILQAAGFPCTWDHALDGVRRFYVNDPWGNRLEFLRESQ